MPRRAAFLAVLALSGPDHQARAEEVRGAATPSLIWKSRALLTPYRPDLTVEEKLAGIARVWSEAKFGFANFDRVPELDWDAEFLAHLKLAREAPTTYEYYRILKRFCALLHDGHTGVAPPDELWDTFYARPAVRTRLVENRVLVIEADDALRAAGFREGAEVVAIDGRPTRDYAEEQVRPYVSFSTPQDGQTRVYEDYLLAGPIEREIRVTLRVAQDGLTALALPRSHTTDERRGSLTPQPSVELRWQPRRVAQVILRTFSEPGVVGRFEALWPEVAEANAIILDLRDNGGGDDGLAFRILARFSDKPLPTAASRTRVYRALDRTAGGTDAWEALPPEDWPAGAGPWYRRPVAVLTSARTYSAAEDFAATFRMMRRGPLVGEPTGGSTGQPFGVLLPGGGWVQICAKRDSFRDGTEFVGVGIVPDEGVGPTADDVRQGRDPVLDAALRHLSEHASSR